jgi:hypothetical protein
MCVSELAISEQWKGKLNSRKFYRHKNFHSISVMHYFCCIVEIKRLIIPIFQPNNRLISIFFLTFVLTIVLNHGQNDEK